MVVDPWGLGGTNPHNFNFGGNMKNVDDLREYVVELAQKFLGIPYIWGGSSPHVGFDCSGFFIWDTQVFKILPSMDCTANDLMGAFKEAVVSKPGDPVFYGNKGRATHIMMYLGVINGVEMVIGASGGDHTTLTEEDAKKRNAMVKIKPLHYRNDFIKVGDLSTFKE
jgi:cell wall-associated NlpC family hydrolase